MERLDEAVVDLLQQLIRNACVNDGSPESGGESRNADALAAVLAGSGVELERYAVTPDRANLVARIEGSDPTAPSLCLLGHTDVVPVNEANWDRDPFGGELVDGYVWGRGAIDMLNLTASMALTMRDLADRGFRPRGDLVFVAVADEESGGKHGARFLCEEHADAVSTDYVITESGGMPLTGGGGTTRLPVLVAERGTLWTTLTVSGTAGHGSMPYGTDNAVVKAAEVVRRLAELTIPVRIVPEWRAFVEDFGLPAQMAEQLTSPELDSVLGLLPPAIAKMAHSSTRTTITPTGLHCTSKTNVIPDTVQIRLDVRTLPGDGREEVQALLAQAIGDLSDSVSVELGDDIPPTRSPISTPLWDSLRRVAQPFYPGAELLPMLSVGGTDNRFFRRTGAVGYGFGLYSDQTSLEELARMGHGDNERIDVRSLEMITAMWSALAHDFLT